MSSNSNPNRPPLNLTPADYKALHHFSQGWWTAALPDVQVAARSPVVARPLEGPGIPPPHIISLHLRPRQTPGVVHEMGKEERWGWLSRWRLRPWTARGSYLGRERSSARSTS